MPQTPQNTPVKPVAPAGLREGELSTMNSPALLRILADESSSEFQKAKACVRLGELGTREAIPALAALLHNEHLSVYARYGLEPIPDPAADDALRAALAKLNGGRLIGVVNSIGKRRDSGAVPALASLLQRPDSDLASASAAALGNIGGLAAAGVLQAALAKAHDPVRAALADACLICAERLLAEGKREEALSLYAVLSARGIPKPMRLAAMSAIIREETAGHFQSNRF